MADKKEKKKAKSQTSDNKLYNPSKYIDFDPELPIGHYGISESVVAVYTNPRHTDMIESARRLADSYGSDFVFLDDSVPFIESIQSIECEYLTVVTESADTDLIGNQLSSFNSLTENYNLATVMPFITERIRPLSYGQRLKKAQTMRRFAHRIELAKERAANRKASPEKIKSRARKRALEIIRARVLKNKSYEGLSASEKMTIDRRLMTVPDATIARIARKMIPVVRRTENQRLQSRFSTVPLKTIKTSHMHEDVNELFEAALKMPHQMYDRHGKVKTDKRFKMYRRAVDENVVDELSELKSSIDEFLSWELEEGINVERAENSISAEREADTKRHKTLLDTARAADKRRAAAETIKNMKRKLTKDVS